MKTLLFTMIALTSLSASAASLPSQCEDKLLKASRAKSIEATTKITQAFGNNLDPVTGAVCKNKKAFNVEETTEGFLVTAHVNPWIGSPSPLKVDCSEAPLSKYPVNKIAVTKDCELKLIGIGFEFDLND